MFQAPASLTSIKLKLAARAAPGGAVGIHGSAATDLAVIFIASARQRRVNYTLPWSRVARVIAAESHSKGKPLADPARFGKGPGQTSVAPIPLVCCNTLGRLGRVVASFKKR